MRLDTLKIRNFKGIREFTLVAGCVDTTIFAANGAGKTTIADAVSFLLFDKDSLGQSIGQNKFEIKPTHNQQAEVEVEATFINGSPVTLKKIYHEVWQTKRGSAEREFKGNETIYHIDDVPVPQAEYKAKVASFAGDENIFRTLTSPTYFNEQMPDIKNLPAWQRRRKILFDISDAKITDEQIIEANLELSDLPKILDGKTPEDRKKIINASKTKLDEKIKGIPARIDEADRGKPELTVTNAQTLIAKLTKLRESLNAKNQEIAQVQAGGGSAELRAKLEKVEAQIKAVVDSHQTKADAALQAKKDDLSNAKDKLAESKRVMQQMTAERGNTEAEISNLTEANKALRAEWDRLKASVFSASDICPTCGQIMPADQIETAKANFNLARAKAMEENKAKGIPNAQRIKTCQASIEQVNGAITATQQLIDGFQQQIDSLAAEVEKGAVVDQLGDDPSYRALNDQKAGIEADITKLAEGNTGIVDRLTAEKTAIENEIAENEGHIAKIDLAQNADTRIAELKAEEKKLAAEYATLEKHLFLIESFTRAKVDALTDSINAKFKICKFRLFREQINGGLEDICEVEVDGVPYNSLNHASRIAAGLDIIQVVGDYYNFHPMIFVDGRESVTELPKIDAQVISLVVSPDDKSLRVVQQ